MSDLHDEQFFSETVLEKEYRAWAMLQWSPGHQTSLSLKTRLRGASTAKLRLLRAIRPYSSLTSCLT